MERIALSCYSLIVLAMAAGLCAAVPQSPGGGEAARKRVATLSTGPFAIRAIETPRVANTVVGRVAAARQGQGRGDFSRVNSHGGVGSPSMFQTADGRVFALSNGGDLEQFTPGQIFQTEDGRFFTLAVAGPKGFVATARRPGSEAARKPASRESLFDSVQEPRALEVVVRQNQIAPSSEMQGRRDEGGLLAQQEAIQNQEIQEQLQQQALEIQKLQRLQQELQLKQLEKHHQLIQRQQQRQLQLQKQQQQELQRVKTHRVAAQRPSRQGGVVAARARAPLTPATSRFVPPRRANVKATTAVDDDVATNPDLSDASERDANARNRRRQQAHRRRFGSRASVLRPVALTQKVVIPVEVNPASNGNQAVAFSLAGDVATGFVTLPDVEFHQF